MDTMLSVFFLVVLIGPLVIFGPSQVIHVTESAITPREKRRFFNVVVMNSGIMLMAIVIGLGTGAWIPVLASALVYYHLTILLCVYFVKVRKEKKREI
ncbi:hypothetical protein [Geomicrobium sp. JCM 19055]|uniref:hypothetical protein n=1 Tax=Geomicrobium sp. JCM 19055 TaxID=1460649 RepID=UPI00045ED01F|nr:hypothetical protein [Geomicrobium sp. JCM 19055]GAJ97839.1 hypothetical protein JCM19055_723 [Geomicrobium sp. JCM 19055]